MFKKKLKSEDLEELKKQLQAINKGTSEQEELKSALLEELELLEEQYKSVIE